MNMAHIRQMTLKRLSALGLVRVPNLPLIESRLTLRSGEEIAHRANVLHILYAIYLQGRESVSYFRELLQERGWERFLTRRECALLSKDVLTEQDLIDFSWVKESIKALLWVGSQIEDDLESDVSECDFALYYPLLPPEKSFENYIQSFILREASLIFEYLDLYYCLHWYCRNHREEISGRVNESVIIERRKAFEWVTHREDWDQISLDT